MSTWYDVFESLMTASDPSGGRYIRGSAKPGIDNENIYTISDPSGGRAFKMRVSSSSGGGSLFLNGSQTVDATLRAVEDGAGTASALSVSSSKVGATALLVSGTAGGGYLQLAYQSVQPTGLANYTTIWADSAGKFSWAKGTGNKRVFDTGTTATDITYTFPNTLAGYTLAALESAQTFTAIQTFNTGAANNAAGVIITGSSGMGVQIGAKSSSIGVIWSKAVTVDGTNYMIGGSTNSTYVNAGSTIYFSIGDSQKGKYTNNTGFGYNDPTMEITPATVQTPTLGTLTPVTFNSLTPTKWIKWGGSASSSEQYYIPVWK